MTVEQVWEKLCSERDALDREYEMAVACYELKELWDYFRRCSLNEQAVYAAGTDRLRTKLSIAERQRDVAVEGLRWLRDEDFGLPNTVREHAHDTLALVREIGEKAVTQ